MGPLAGLAAGLRYAQDEDFASVLTCGVDSVGLPSDLLDLLTPAPAFLESQPVVGHWPVEASAIVEELLHGPGPDSMRALVQALGAVPAKAADLSANVNTPEDLAAAAKKYKL